MLSHLALVACVRGGTTRSYDPVIFCCDLCGSLCALALPHACVHHPLQSVLCQWFGIVQGGFTLCIWLRLRQHIMQLYLSIFMG
jgi:hypothetical protein